MTHGQIHVEVAEIADARIHVRHYDHREPDDPRFSATMGTAGSQLTIYLVGTPDDMRAAAVRLTEMADEIDS